MSEQLRQEGGPRAPGREEEDVERFGGVCSSITVCYILLVGE